MNRKAAAFLLVLTLFFVLTAPAVSALETDDDFSYIYDAETGTVTVDHVDPDHRLILAGYRGAQMVFSLEAQGQTDPICWTLPPSPAADDLRLFFLDDDHAPVRPSERLLPTLSGMLEDARVVVNGTVYICGLGVQDGAWYLTDTDARKIFGKPAAGLRGWVRLSDIAAASGFSCEQDELLGSAYCSSYTDYNALFDCRRGFSLGFVPESLRGETDRQITSTEFRAMLSAMIASLAPARMDYFDSRVTADHAPVPLTREYGFVMAYYAAAAIGADVLNNSFDSNLVTDDMWGPIPDAYGTLFPQVLLHRETVCDWEWGGSFTTDDEYTMAYLFSFWHKSPLSGEMLFSFDADAGSMHQNDPLTVADAAAAATRLYDSAARTIVSVDDAAVSAANPDVLTSELLTLAQSRPTVTADDHPRWSGFQFGQDDTGTIDTSAAQLVHAANWGFNSVRVLFDYQGIFDHDLTTADLQQLIKLDQLVATAIQYDLHLNLAPLNLPGRLSGWNPEDFTSWGEFDLFINEDKQTLCNKMWTLLAMRYKDVPSANLTFTPFMEALNYDLSTGLPYEPYTPVDVGAYLSEVICEIRAADNDRLIIYEPTGRGEYSVILEEASDIKEAIADLENVMISYNYGEGAFVYAYMTAATDEHIDNNNRGGFLPDYPTRFYSIRKTVLADSPITIGGCLPAGTVFDLYLRESRDSTLKIAVDGETYCTEDLGTAEYSTEQVLSRYYRYAQSDKHIQIVLEEAADEIVLSAERGMFEWSGMDITLPDEYAVERWYFRTAYDVFKGLEEEEGVIKRTTSRVMLCANDDDYGTAVTIHDNVTYTSEHIWQEASAETIGAWGDGIADFDGNCAVRFERAGFSGGVWDSIRAYYTDLLGMLYEHGCSWWSNDWWMMTDEYAQTKLLGGVEYQAYQRWPYFNPELLQLLQSYQYLD